MVKLRRQDTLGRLLIVVAVNTSFMAIKNFISCPDRTWTGWDVNIQATAFLVTHELIAKIYISLLGLFLCLLDVLKVKRFLIGVD